jgi:excisionase family DNA binding protein
MPRREAKQVEVVTGPDERWIIPPKYGDRASFTIRETAEILGISPWTAWDAAKKGELPVIRIGRRKIVPRVHLEKLMNSGS